MLAFAASQDEQERQRTSCRLKTVTFLARDNIAGLPPAATGAAIFSLGL